MKKFDQGDFKLAIIVDAQFDFMDPTGALPVPHADEIIETLNDYLRSLTVDNGYVGVLFTADTHNEETYPNSLEAIGDSERDIPGFPPHCYEGTDGFNFAIDPSCAVVDSNFKRSIINKGVFDMWEENGLVVRPYALSGEPVPYGGEQDRDEFFRNLLACGVEDVEVVGVAADFCVKWAIEGLVTRGFRVTVYDNLTAGIARNIHQVVEEDFNEQFDIIQVL